MERVLRQLRVGRPWIPAALQRPGMVYSQVEHPESHFVLQWASRGPNIYLLFHCLVPGSKWVDTSYSPEQHALLPRKNWFGIGARRMVNPVRPLVTIDQLWMLAIAWYSDPIAGESRRPSAARCARFSSAWDWRGIFGIQNRELRLAWVLTLC